MSRRVGLTSPEVSPQRQDRLARNATLEMVVADLDLRTPDGRSGVTASMLSGWELGRHVTNMHYRQVLCDY